MLTPALWYYLSLRLWEPAFVGAEATFTTIAVWVQLGGLPIEFYYMTTLNRLGKEWNLRVDKEREERARSTFRSLPTMAPSLRFLCYGRDPWSSFPHSLLTVK